ncbi:MAG: HD domain-containing protein [Lachnospirales bacterium]
MYNKILNNKIFINSMNKINELEKDRIFCCHSIEHSLDVARISYIISLEKGLNISKDVIYITALLHDIGRCRGGSNHNLESVNLASEILKGEEFKNLDKNIILDAISNHRNKTDELNNLSDIISYADKISRNCFNCKAYTKCYWDETRKNKNIIY